MQEYSSPNKSASQTREEYIQKTFSKISKRAHFIGLLAKLDEESKKTLARLAKQFEQDLVASSSEPVSSPNKIKQGAKDSFLYELEMILQTYDECETPTSVEIKFQEVFHYLGNPVENEKVNEVHEKLVQHGRAAKIADLVISTTRGKLYAEWKINNPHGDFRKTFKISPRQGCRYTQFFYLIKKYPRLLISGFTMSELVVREKAIEERAEGKHSFDALLRGPLNEFQIGDDLFDVQSQLEKLSIAEVNLD